jgi:hypothetical protein
LFRAGSAVLGLCNAIPTAHLWHCFGGFAAALAAEPRCVQAAPAGMPATGSPRPQRAATKPRPPQPLSVRSQHRQTTGQMPAGGRVTGGSRPPPKTWRSGYRRSLATTLAPPAIEACRSSPSPPISTQTRGLRASAAATAASSASGPGL